MWYTTLTLTYVLLFFLLVRVLERKRLEDKREDEFIESHRTMVIIPNHPYVDSNSLISILHPILVIRIYR